MWDSIGRLFVSVLLLWGAIGAPLAQDPNSPPAPSVAIDPLTGQPIAADPAVDEAPPRADLSGANDLVREQRYDEAEQVLADLEVDFPEDPALLLMHGEVLLALGRPADALKPLRNAAEVDPERPRLQFQLAAALLGTGDGEAAIEAFGRELSHSEDEQVRLLAHLNRSMLFQQTRQWDEAAAELEAVLAAYPERTEAFGDLSALYVEAGQLDEALAALERGVEAGFRSADHFYSLGARFYKEERYEKSAEALGRSIEIEPQNPRAERSLAAALEQLGRDDQAVAHLERYLELSPDAPDRERVEEKIRAARGS